jgi:exodeoxyribonuclease III
MRIITANLNGIRSATTKGFFPWLETQNADILGVQELKAQRDDLSQEMVQPASMASSKTLQGAFHFAEKKGYSGVGIYSAKEPSDIVYGIENEEFDLEGRWVEMRFDTPSRKLSFISSYFPSGSSSDERQEAKFRYLDHVLPRITALAKEREFVLMGDINIAHQNIDLKNWKGNVKNSGFTPEERAWMSSLLEGAGLVDVYRHLHPQESELAYTWWSQRGQAYAKNVGWRIDYQLATPNLANGATHASVFKDLRFSDHAPLIIDYNWNI